MKEEEKRKGEKKKKRNSVRGKPKGKKNLRFSVFRWSKVDSLRIKVVLLDESYE